MSRLVVFCLDCRRLLTDKQLAPIRLDYPVCWDCRTAAALRYQESSR